MEPEEFNELVLKVLHKDDPDPSQFLLDLLKDFSVTDIQIQEDYEPIEISVTGIRYRMPSSVFVYNRKVCFIVRNRWGFSELHHDYIAGSLDEYRKNLLHKAAKSNLPLWIYKCRL